MAETSEIPFVDLTVQHDTLRGEIDAAIARVLDSNQFVLGEEVEAFEREFAGFCEADHALGLNSGSSALHLAFLAAGIGPGDEVVTAAMTFVASAACVLYTGARPVLVDVDPKSYTMDPEALSAAITERTRAVVPVHLYGQPADMDPILEIARERGLTVIEDACQAHGARYKGKRVGTLGHMGCFSFYPGKNLGACGEGGALVTNDPEIARKVAILRDWGQDGKYNHVLPGYNYRMDAIHGAVLRVKLDHLDEWTRLRRSRATRYDEGLSRAGIDLPTAMPYAEHVYHVYATRARDRERLQRQLADRGVQTNIHYPSPVHLLPAHRDLGREGDFPVAERLGREELSLPLFPEMSDDQVDEVCAAVVGLTT